MAKRQQEEDVAVDAQPALKKSKKCSTIDSLVEIGRAQLREVGYPDDRSGKGKLPHHVLPAIANFWTEEPRLDHMGMPSGLAKITTVVRRRPSKSKSKTSSSKFQENFQNNQGDRKFLTGPKGCGKSIVALEAACQRWLSNDARAILVKLSGTRTESCWEVLLQAVVHAFCLDQRIISRCRDILVNNKVEIGLLKDLYLGLPDYCVLESNKKGLLLIVDSVEAISDDLEDFFKVMLETPSWKKNASVLFVGTNMPRNGLDVGEAVHMDPVMEEDAVRELFNMEKVTVVVKNKDSKESKNNLALIQRYTGFVPGELVRFVQVYKTEVEKLKEVPKDTVKFIANVAEVFASERRDQLEAEVEEYLTSVTTGEQQAILSAILWMKGDIPVTNQMAYMLYSPLMYEKAKNGSKKAILPISQLAREVLVDRIKGLSHEARLELVKSAFDYVFAKSTVYDQDVVTYAVKQFIMSVVSVRGTLTVKGARLLDTKKMKLEKPSEEAWVFEPKEIILSESISEGYKFDGKNLNDKLFYSSNLDKSAFIVEDDSATTFGVTGVEVCLDLHKAAPLATRFFEKQGREWAEAANLEAASDVRLLWLVTGDPKEVQNVKDTKAWSRCPDKWEDTIQTKTGKVIRKQATPSHYFVNLKSLCQDNDILPELFEDDVDVDVDIKADVEDDDPPQQYDEDDEQ